MQGVASHTRYHHIDGPHDTMMAMRVLTKRLSVRRMQTSALRALSTEIPPVAATETTEAVETSEEDLGNLADVPISQVTRSQECSVAQRDGDRD